MAANGSERPEIDFSPYNQSTEWKRIELAHSSVRNSLELYVFIAAAIVVVAVPINLFLILQILRFTHRRTVINYLIVWSSLCNLVALIHPVAIIVSNFNLCTSTFLLFPTITLFQKLCLTALAVVRHMYVFCNTLVYQGSILLLITGVTVGVVLITSLPLITLSFEAHPLWATCLLISDIGTPTYIFLFTLLVIMVNSIIVDCICYARILNYMRVNAVRVTVVASTRIERIKSHNIVTAPSSLLIWLVVIVSMIPSSIMVIKSGSSIDASHIITLINYQQALVLVFTVIVPVLYIGSSGELRRDVALFRKLLCKPCQPRQRLDIYSVEMHNYE